MCQKEVYQKLCSNSGKEYIPLSVLYQLSGNISKVCVVKPSSFIPQPKCDSVVFKVTNVDNNDNVIIIEYNDLCSKLRYFLQIVRKKSKKLASVKSITYICKN